LPLNARSQDQDATRAGNWPSSPDTGGCTDAGPIMTVVVGGALHRLRQRVGAVRCDREPALSTAWSRRDRLGGGFRYTAGRPPDLSGGKRVVTNDLTLGVVRGALHGVSPPGEEPAFLTSKTSCRRPSQPCVATPSFGNSTSPCCVSWTCVFGLVVSSRCLRSCRSRGALRAVTAQPLRHPQDHRRWCRPTVLL